MMHRIDAEPERAPLVYNERLSTKTPRLAWHEIEPPLPRLNAPKEPPPHYKPVPPLEPRTRSRRAVRPNLDTGYYGVQFVGDGRYRVAFVHEGTPHTAGVYATPEDAAWAHDEYCRTRGIDRPLNGESRERGSA